MTKIPKLWQSTQGSQYFWYALTLSVLVLFPASALALSNNWQSIIVSVAIIVGLVAGATVMANRYLEFDQVESVVSHHLRTKESFLVFKPKAVTVVLNKENLSQVSHIWYDTELYFSDSAVHGGYKFSYEFYQPGVFICEVSFTNSLRSNLIFVVERINAVDYLTTVYGYTRK